MTEGDETKEEGETAGAGGSDASHPQNGNRDGRADHVGGAVGTRLLRDLWAFLVYTERRFMDDNLFQAAAALTYTTILSLVPAAAITIAILSAFPAFTEIQVEMQSLIFQMMVPEVGAAVRDQLLTLAENAGRLTAFGLVGMMVTAFLLLFTIESAFNSLWRVRTSRSFMIRLLSFWAVLTATPILAAFGITMAVQAVQGAPFDEDVRALTSWMTVLIAPAVEFTVLILLFLIIPNRQVRYMDSAIGAAIGTLLLELARWGFSHYIGAAPTYETVYGALAVIPIFLLWIYLVWSIVLVGALVAAALPDWRAGRMTLAMGEPGTRFRRLSAAVSVIDVLYQASLSGQPARRRTIRRALGMSSTATDRVLEDLREARFVAQTANDQWLLARDIRIATLWDLVVEMGFGFGEFLPPETVTDRAHRLATLVVRSRDASREILSVPLHDVIAASAGRPDLEQAEESEDAAKTPAVAADSVPAEQ